MIGFDLEVFDDQGEKIPDGTNIQTIQPSDTRRMIDKHGAFRFMIVTSRHGSFLCVHRTTGGENVRIL